MAGREQRGEVFKQPLRVVWVKTGKTDSQGRPEILLLASDLVDVDAAWIALGYKFRWTVELFFRWFKCILGCQHLLSTSQNGVTIQVYLALIASLLVSLWTGHKPTKRTFEMLCFYFSGWASEAELQARLAEMNDINDMKVTLSLHDIELRVNGPGGRVRASEREPVADAAPSEGARQ